MLQICDVHKQYKTGDLVQTALDGVSLSLRDNEFVAILGPSGSGKTTLLNVIGGLDRYDSGDLIINGISTKRYSDRDWDSYRNHTIGFVFQSYNLIPHQTVLANVELALTISGISRAERRKRAAKALEDVGLGDQLHKRPNQMSGGQMQRVAIARALVNDPDILLADEPTGALDSETSVQVMNLLKEVSKDRLVVMVTHNPELAYEYANRIVRVKDGKIVDDSNPYILEIESEVQSYKNLGKASMSFFTALALSFNNLRTKKGRTILTAFAGSIGIIGIALILSLSTGFQIYIDQIQEDTLSNYPLTIQSETADMMSMMSVFSTVLGQGADAEPETVMEQQMISQMFAQVGANDLGSFKHYLEENAQKIQEGVNDIKYSYGIKPLIFSADTSNGVLQANPGELFGQITGMSAFSAYMDSDVFYEMVQDRQMLDTQYDVLRGRWPESANELVVVLSSPSQISDYIAYTLGLRDPESLLEMIQKVMDGQEVEAEEEPMQWTYDDLMALEFRLVPAAAMYRYNPEYTVWEDMSDDETYVKKLVDEGQALKVVGIVCPADGSSATILTPGVAYTHQLTQQLIEASNEFQVVKDQLADQKKDVFTGLEFGADSSERTELDFKDMISVDEGALRSAFGVNINQSQVMKMLESYVEQAYNSIEVDTTPAQKDFLDTLSQLCRQMLKSYISANANPGTGRAKIYLSDAEGIVAAYLNSADAQQLLSGLESKYQLSADTFRQVYSPLMQAMVTSFISENMTVVPDIPDVPDVTLPSVPDIPDVSDVTLPSVPDAPTLPDLPEVTLPSIPEVTLPETEPPVTEPPTAPPEQETQAAENTDPVAAQNLHTTPEVTTQPDATEPDSSESDTDVDLSFIYAVVSADQVDGAVNNFMQLSLVNGSAGVMAGKMMEPTIRGILAQKVTEFGGVLMRYVGNSFYVNEEAFSEAFQFNMSEDDLRRLMEAMTTPQKERSAKTNLQSLGYADMDEPTAISIYFVDFAAKENFLAFLDDYNVQMEADGKEDLIISYTDVTGMMMSSVRTIIDSVSYVLIAFVAVSLVVSSIMIGIITYISVMERTKEIGVLRAIGASKRNISQVFNAETFIIGLCSGLIGVGITILLNIPINYIIHRLTDNTQINAQLPITGAVILIILSMILTLIGGLIPSKHAAKKDPVIALRSE